MPSRDDAGFVRVRGAREHNLKDVDLDLPRDALVVFSGVSGSGKSSLAFGTLYAESQRRFFESVSPYARRLIDQVGVPDVDSIEGLPPAVALQQARGAANLRSTVGSLSTISRIWFTMRGASPSDGSSSSRRRGLDMRLRATASICCCPPDRRLASEARRSSRIGNSANASSRRAA